MQIISDIFLANKTDDFNQLKDQLIWIDYIMFSFGLQHKPLFHKLYKPTKTSPGKNINFWGSNIVQNPWRLHEFLFYLNYSVLYELFWNSASERSDLIVSKKVVNIYIFVIRKNIHSKNIGLFCLIPRSVYSTIYYMIKKSSVLFAM